MASLFLFFVFDPCLLSIWYEIKRLHAEPRILSLDVGKDISTPTVSTETDSKKPAGCKIKCRNFTPQSVAVL